MISLRFSPVQDGRACHAPSRPRAWPARGRTVTSLRHDKRRDLDTAIRRILKGVRSHVDQGQLRAIDGSDSPTERVFVAARKGGGELQIHSVAAVADPGSGLVQPAVQFARIGWLREIETCRTD